MVLLSAKVSLAFEDSKNKLEFFRQVISGDKSSFSKFIRLYQKKIFNFCYSFFLDYAKAEDLMQETFLKFYQSSGNIKQIEKLESYLFQVARNLCRDTHRKKKEILISPIKDNSDSGGVSLEKLTRPDTRTPEKKYISREQREFRSHQAAQLHEKMKDLDEDQRAAIYLIHFEKLSYAKAAKILQCPEGTVKSRVNRGIKSLSKMFASNETYQQQGMMP